MIPKGWTAEQANEKLQELRTAAIQKSRQNAATTGRSVSGEEVMEEVREKWAEFCGVPFVPQWKLNGWKGPRQLMAAPVGVVAPPDEQPTPEGLGADGLAGVVKVNPDTPLAPKHESSPTITHAPNITAPGPQSTPGPTGAKVPPPPPATTSKPVVEKKETKGVVQNPGPPPVAAPPKV